jgi:hypothetical protein
MKIGDPYSNVSNVIIFQAASHAFNIILLSCMSSTWQECRKPSPFQLFCLDNYS